MRGFVIVVCLIGAVVPCVAADSSGPRGADVVLGTADSYQPAARWHWQDGSLELPLSLRTRFEGVNGFPLDRDGTELGKSFFMVPQLRVGGRLEWTPENVPVRFFGEYEHDLATGTLVGAPEVAGQRLPNGEKTHNELRKLFGRLTIADLIVVSGGFNTSHWGLGLLANDGAHGWTPGSARFSDPRSGDRVLRTSIGTVPLSDYGLVMRVAYDVAVIGDETLLAGDDAHQYIFSALAGDGRATSGGIYLVYREQDSRVSRGFDVFVGDATVSTAHDIQNLGTLTVAGEFVAITGHATLGPTADFPRHDIFELAGTLRASLDRGGHGGVLEVLYASGDQNADDGDQNAFRIDPNYEYGLLLFRYVVAGQTGRAPVTAGNLVLQGRPVPDLERVPTAGSPTNTIAIFPRAWWRPRNGLEAYGGPMFAFSEVHNADPFNTHEAGGDPHSALNGHSGNFWGTELDLGVRYRALLDGAEATLGIEAGVLFPGSALRDASGSRMDEVFGARAMIDYRL